MLQFLRDRLTTLRLKARYERLVHEKLLDFTESASRGIEEDSPGWLPAGSGQRGLPATARDDIRSRARELIHTHPHARHILRLMEAYVSGPELKVTVRLIPSAMAARDALHSLGEQLAPDVLRLFDRTERWWQRFLDVNQRHYSFREHARRTWRDGEAFLRFFPNPQGPPAVRFIDPEWIGSTREAPDSQGILTLPDDVESPWAYLRINPESGELEESIPADDLLHTRIGVDSNEKRGVSLFAPLIEALDHYDRWLQTELLARKLQASIVLWRKVQGSPADVLRTSEAAAGGRVSAVGTSRERFQPGTILTTNQGTEVQFLQPRTNFTDAVPLGRMLLLSIAAGAGLPEFMLTSDASNGNYASTMVAEGPAVKLFQAEQQFFAREWNELWRRVMQAGIMQGELPDDLFTRVEPAWTFPVVVNRDRSRERLTDARLVESRILSRAEVARRDGVDPSVMRCELAEEEGSPSRVSTGTD